MMNLDMNADTRKQRVYWTMYLKRIFSLRQMDLDYSFSQMIQICISPTKVYKMTAWRKQTKNQWARDDPSFILITLFFVASIAAAYSIAIRPGCVTCLMYRKSLIQSVFFSLLAGIVVATLSCYWINHSMRIQRPHSPEQFVEWLYALDIHFNAFFPALLIMGVLQYVFLPFIVRTQFISTFVADMACIAAICYYCYITFLGYMYLPFVKTPFVFLIIGGVLCCVVLVFMSFGMNIPKRLLLTYFSSLDVCYECPSGSL